MNQQEGTERTEGDEATLRDAIATITRVRSSTRFWSASARLRLIRIFSDEGFPSSVGSGMSDWGPDEEHAGADAHQNLAEIDLKSGGCRVLEFWKAVRPRKKTRLANETGPNGLLNRNSTGRRNLARRAGPRRY